MIDYLGFTMKAQRAKRELIAIVFVTTLGTFFLSYVSYMVLENKTVHSLLTLWNRWDTIHYLDIARNWYSSTTEGERHLRIVFFPLYPALVKVVSLVLRNHMLSALIVSNVSYALCILYLYKLVLLDYEEKTAVRAAFYLSVFPTAYFLHAGYTESLYLALTVSSFYYARKGNWWLSGITGMFASATRITGMVLLPALLFEYMLQRDFKVRAIGKNIIWLFLIPLGLFSYLAINYITFGSPFKFLEFQKEHWFKTLITPWKGLTGAWSSTLWRQPNERVLVGWAELVSGILGYVLTLIAFLRIRLSYAAYLLLTWVIVTSTSYWLSLPRYMLSAFPVFIVLSLIGERKEAGYLIVFLSLTLFTLFMSLFVQGRWAF
jgi:Gpi18-like mannosyltransferase